MNSFAITFNALASESDFHSSFAQYEQIKESSDKFDVLEEYAKWTSCIGNFVLVPKGYNGYRGLSKQLCDYWDLSLDSLRCNKDGRDWLDMSFAQYINTFFLWDYVDAGYCVRPLFPGHRALLDRGRDLVLPHQYEKEHMDEFDIFTKNAGIRIHRRGLFMVAMLKIVVNGKSDYHEIVKKLSLMADDYPMGTMEDMVQFFRGWGKCKFSDETILTLSNLVEQLEGNPLGEEN